MEIPMKKILCATDGTDHSAHAIELAAGLVVAGYLYYQESQSGIDIQIGGDGVKIEGN